MIDNCIILNFQFIVNDMPLFWYNENRRNAKQMRDYGKSLQWPEPPKTLSHLRPLFNKAFHRWRAFMVLSKHPRETWEELHQKITAIENLRGKRATWGIERYN